jgi:hypothetical protein
MCLGVLTTVLLIGESSSGSTRANRASFLRRLYLVVLAPFAVDVRRTLRALATRTSWPYSSSRRLTQGEWVPVSIAMRIGAMPEKRLWKALVLVGMRLFSSITSPFSLSRIDIYVGVAVTEIDAGGRLVRDAGTWPKSSFLCGSGSYDSPTLTIVGSIRSVVSAFSSHLDRGYAGCGLPRTCRRRSSQKTPAC